MNANNKFCRMLCMVAAESFRARTMPMRSPLTSVTPALAMAMSVPPPMAMPTSAEASAGASLMPSPAMATILPARRLDRGTFSFRQDLRFEVGNAELIGNRKRRAAAVAGQHDDGNALRLQRVERGAWRRLQRIGDGNEARERAVDGDEDHRAAIATQPFGLVFQVRGGNAELGETFCVGDRDPP